MRIGYVISHWQRLDILQYNYVVSISIIYVEVYVKCPTRDFFSLALDFVFYEYEGS